MFLYVKFYNFYFRIIKVAYGFMEMKQRTKLTELIFFQGTIWTLYIERKLKLCRLSL